MAFVIGSNKYEVGITARLEIVRDAWLMLDLQVYYEYN